MNHCVCLIVLFPLQDCFAKADANGDGTITFDEFKQWYSSLDESDRAFMGQHEGTAPALTPVGASVPRIHPISDLMLGSFTLTCPVVCLCVCAASARLA